MILITSANLRWSKRYSKARSASGGIVYGGEADGSTSDVLQRSASGGVVYGGSASGVIESVFRSASGGIVYGGTANLTEFTVFRSASGGITYGGTAVPQLAVVWREAEGGITYGGSANIVMDISSPTQIANCINWLDATDASTLYADTGKTTLAAIDGTVAAWEDKSSFGHDFTNSLASQPIRKNGYLLFGENLYLTGDWRGSFASVDAITFFAVVEDKTENGASYFFENETRREFSVYGTNITATAFGRRTSSGSAAFASTAYSGALKNLISTQIDYTGSNTVKIQTNDNISAESTAMVGSGANVLDGSLILNSRATNQTFRYLEMVAYNRALSTAEIEAVKAYLKSKHNL